MQPRGPRRRDAGALLGARDVVELAVRVIVQDQQPQARPPGLLGEGEHRDVAVGVAGRQQRPPADPVPDPHRLGGTVVQDIHLRLADDRAAVAVVVPD